MNWILLAAMLWALVLLDAFLSLPRVLARWSRVTQKRAVVLVVGVALIARLVPNFLLPVGAGYDIESYQIVGNLVLKGSDVYTSPDAVNRHPYLPFQMYWMGFALWVSREANLPFVKIVRLAPIVADAGIAVLVFKSLQRRLYEDGRRNEALLGGLSYAVNPIPVFVSAYHGQFDAIPALFLLLAVVRLEGSPLMAGGWLGLGILDKSWPVLAVPSLLGSLRGRGKKVPFLILAGTVPLLGTGIYIFLFNAYMGPTLSQALRYNWGVGVWGYSYFLHLLSVLVPGLGWPLHWIVRNGRYLTLVALGLVWLTRARKEAPEAGILTILVTFFAVTHAFSIQYLVWIVPFALLNRERRWLTRYTLAVFAYMLLVYTTLILEMHITQLLPWPQADWFIIMPAGLPAWLVTVGWVRRRLLGKSLRVENSAWTPLNR